MGLFTRIIESWERRKTLKEFNQTLSVNKEHRFWDFKNAMEEALALFERDHVAQAKALWYKASSEFPDESLDSPLTIKLLLKLRMYKELDDLAIKAIRKKPNDPLFLEGLAQSANDQAKFEAASEYSNRLIRMFPDRRAGYLAAANALSGMGRATEAEKVIAKAFSRLGDDLTIFIEYARIADRKEDWEAALARWHDVYKRFKHATGIAGSLRALGELKRFDEADALFEDVRFTYGNEFSVWTQFARNAERRDDWAEANIRWEQFRQRFPRSSLGFIEGSAVLRRLGLEAEAEDLLGIGASQVDPEPKILAEYAFAAHRRSAWEAADERWSAYRKIFPDRSEGFVQGSAVLERLGRSEDSKQLRHQAPHPVN
ncbi:MAG TPA: hypothetical protein VHB27_14335 [Rhodopila sp.]|uniref:tetratricopeptide repeat protein n=1 Tax=Rhodopila sp. TaxID=2480087 RepID=UPI002B7BD00B|nr:hypothetical protein [Rhodopila sp.]HVY16400.1 hypothetical protein [Rhodopila sp.]